MRMKKAAKRLLGGALALAMAVGIFAGTGMEVRAGQTYNVADLIEGKVLQCGDQIECMNGERVTVWYYASDETSSGPIDRFNSQSQHTIGEGISQENLKKMAWKIKAKTVNVLVGSTTYYMIDLVPDIAPASTSTTGEQSDNSTTAPHTHSYSWVTVQDASVGQDGLEEYRCSCGDVQERCVIPASAVAVKGLYGAVKDAPQGGTASFDSGRLYTLSDYVIKKLAERTDVTTVITFEYQNQAYKMTIPAGVDYTSLLSDGDYFYGYFYFANAVGATIEAAGV